MSISFNKIEKDEYEALCEDRNIPLTQNWFYGEWQVAMGKKVWRYSIKGGGETVGFFQVIKYPMPFGKSFLYIPHGPVLLAQAPNELVLEFDIFCRELLNRENAVFLRFEPTWELSSQVKIQLGNSVPKLAGSSYRVPKFMYDGGFQPKFEWILNLEQSEVLIMAQMKKVNRYMVRHAKKLGVEVEIVERNFSQYLDKFYELIGATAERDEFSHNSKEYYAKIFKVCERNKNAFMEVAYHEGQIVLVNFFVIYGDSVFFLFSGSENEHRRVGYAYLAQWEAIKYVKKRGLKNYNFGAVITDDNKHPFYKTWKGFSDFKKRFGGSLVEYANFYDIINSKFWYALFMVRKIVILIRRQIF